MHRKLICLVVLMLAMTGGLFAAERKWDFSEMTVDQPPKGCFSTVAGEGKPGTWKILMDEFPLALQPLSPGTAKTAPKAVAAQFARDYTDNHFPLLVLGDGAYGDFTFKTQFKIVDGLTEQMAGIVFRMQDEKNFYYVRVDAAANKLSLYGFLKGNHVPLYSENRTIQKGVWHELIVEAEGSKFRIGLDGQFMPVISEKTFSVGKIAFYAKSDTIAYFTDARVTYTPHEPFVQSMVKDVMQEFPRLLGLKIIMIPPKEKQLRLVASNNESEIGQPGEKHDADVIERGINYYRKDKDTLYVTMPLRDRNGEPVAAVRFVMKSFTGQTEENALVRAMPMLKKLQLRASAVDSIY